MRNDYEINGDVAYIYAKSKGQRYVITVDAEDVERLIEFNRTWCVAPNNQAGMYAKNNSAKMYLHRFIVNAPKGMEVDHINQNTLDNRKENLRIVTSAENKQNRNTTPRNNTSGVRGVQWNKQRDKWKARITINKKEHHVGFFDNISDAEKAISDFKKQYVHLSPESMENPESRKDLSQMPERIRSDNKTGIKGVSWEQRRKKWKVSKNEKFIGYFSSIEDAKAAYENYKEG